MGLKNGLIFGGINSLDYGIYISGDAVFNAPSRKVDLIQIPGRNGDFALDHGRFENIEVSYPAGTFGDDQKDFREKLSDFRNAILSQVGYQRLSDTYHPDEYRLGVYMSGLDVDPAHYNTAGEFVLTFNCKPQRWLTSGETAVTVGNSDTLTNPTYFESSPLLAVDGYGSIAFNGYEIEIDNGALGTIQLAGSKSFYTSTTISLENISSLNASDVIYFSGDSVTTTFNVRDRKHQYNWTSGSVASASHVVSASFFAPGYQTATIKVVANTNTRFAKGTSSTITSSATINVNGHGAGTLAFSMTITFAYDGNDTIVVTKSITASGTYAYVSDIQLSYGSDTLPEVYGDSTKNFLGNPTYIDCDLGECYKYEGGEIVNLNGVITLGSDLPTLAPGANEFTLDNTVTELNVTPRWWKV